MLNVMLKQFTWCELMRPFGIDGDRPITDKQFEDLMRPTNDDVSIEGVKIRCLSVPEDWEPPVGAQ
ncbi:MAG: hypothetical protein Q8O31_07135 [Rhodocyclaceae bacterium]|nr:hypothetical protein [Rhodocyclaceae bacterium]